MKAYGLTVEAGSPVCGGQLPRVFEIAEIRTDDPIGYVRRREPGLELAAEWTSEGDLVVGVEAGQRRLRYRFTEKAE